MVFIAPKVDEKPTVIELEVHPYEIRHKGEPLDSERAALLIRLLQVHYFPTMAFKERPATKTSLKGNK